MTQHFTVFSFPERFTALHGPAKSETLSLMRARDECNTDLWTPTKIEIIQTKRSDEPPQARFYCAGGIQLDFIKPDSTDTQDVSYLFTVTYDNSDSMKAQYIRAEKPVMAHQSGSNVWLAYDRPQTLMWAIGNICTKILTAFMHKKDRKLDLYLTDKATAQALYQTPQTHGHTL